MSILVDSLLLETFALSGLLDELEFQQELNLECLTNCSIRIQPK